MRKLKLREFQWPDLYLFPTQGCRDSNPGHLIPSTRLFWTQIWLPSRSWPHHSGCYFESHTVTWNFLNARCLRKRNTGVVSLQTFSLQTLGTPASINSRLILRDISLQNIYSQKRHPFILALSFKYLFNYFHQHPASFYLLPRVWVQGRENRR